MTFKLNALTPMLLCQDVPGCLAFYTEALGFTISNQLEDVGKSGWASLRRDGVTLMIASPDYTPSAIPIDGRHTQAIHYFYCDDVEAIRTAVLAAGYDAGEPRLTFYKHKEIDLVDPEGHMLTFGQAMDSEEGSD